MATREDHWQDVYRSKGEADVSWFQQHPDLSLQLITSYAPAPARVIDIGGGASRLVDELLARGYQDVSVLDLSDEALKKSQQRLGPAATKVHWIVADATQWQAERSYDLWHDRAAFHFLTQDEQRSAYRERLLNALEMGGHAIIATFAPDGPERCSGLPIMRYSPQDLAQVLGPKLALVASKTESHVTPWGAEQRFQYSVFKRLPD